MPTYTSSAGSLGTSIETAEITAGAVTLPKLDSTTITDPLLKRWVLQETKDLSAGVTSSTFASLPAKKMWKLVGWAKPNNAANVELSIRFNGDTGNNYESHYISDTSINLSTGMSESRIAFMGGTSGVNVACPVQLLFAGTPPSDKLAVKISGYGVINAGTNVSCLGAYWSNAATVTSLTVFNHETRSFKGQLGLYYSEDV